MNFTTRQVEIIEASKYLIGKKGIQNLTIKNLAKKMSFSEPAIYRHFKDKTEILKALLLFHREIIKSEIIKILDSEKPSLIKIQEIFKFKFKHIEKNPAFVMIIFSELFSIILGLKHAMISFLLTSEYITNTRSMTAH